MLVNILTKKSHLLLKLSKTFLLKNAICYLNFIVGFGLSLCYVAAIIIVAYYFDRRRSFATGISVCGSGVGEEQEQRCD